MLTPSTSALLAPDRYCRSVTAFDDGATAAKAKTRRALVLIDDWSDDASLFDWRVVNRFEMILHQNAFDGPRSHRAQRLCCDIATKTAAVDKRGDLSDMLLMIAHGAARLKGRRCPLVLGNLRA